jgi:hypothetical protein
MRTSIPAILPTRHDVPNIASAPFGRSSPTHPTPSILDPGVNAPPFSSSCPELNEGLRRSERRATSTYPVSSSL